MNAVLVSFVLALMTGTTGHAATRASPEARQILTRMAQAVKSKNSVHIQMEIHVATQQSVHLIVQVKADVQNHPRRIFEQATTSMSAVGVTGGTSTGRRVDIAVVGNRAALRISGQSWRCDTVRHLMGTYVDVFRSLNPIVRNATLAGTATVDGVAVWHVRAVSSVTVLGQTSSMPTDLFIARQDYALVRTDAGMTVQDRAGTIRERVIERFSHYGERVNGRFPIACPA